MVFWLFSIGIYVWADQSLGEGFVTKVREQQVDLTDDREFGSVSDNSVSVAGDIALQQIKTILLLINGSLVLIIPITSYLLASRTLKPLELAHERQQQFVSDSSHEIRTPLTVILGEIDVSMRKGRTETYYKKRYAT